MNTVVAAIIVAISIVAGIGIGIGIGIEMNKMNKDEDKELAEFLAALKTEKKKKKKDKQKKKEMEKTNDKETDEEKKEEETAVGFKTRILFKAKPIRSGCTIHKVYPVFASSDDRVKLKSKVRRNLFDAIMETTLPHTPGFNFESTRNGKKTVINMKPSKDDLETIGRYFDVKLAEEEREKRAPTKKASSF